MADSTDRSSEDQFLGLLVVSLMSLIAGLVINSFIIGVNVTDWWKGRSLTSVDHIVTSLGISRICCASSAIVYLVKQIFFLTSLNSYLTLFFLGTVYIFFVNVNIWLTSLLSVVLCLKISNLHTRLFLYLKRMILHRTGYFIVAAVISSALNGLLPIWLSITKLTGGGTYNTTMAYVSDNCLYDNFIYTLTIGTSIPLLFYCISSVLLFTSLYHHTTRMKMSSNLSINLETYYSMMRFVSVTFIYSTAFFICHFATAFYQFLYCVKIVWLYIILAFLSLLHSSYMIYRTAKLRTQMSRVLHNVIGFLFQRKDTETRENIEVEAL